MFDKLANPLPQATLAICQRLCDEFSLKLKADVLINSKRQHFDILFEEAQDFELIVF